MSITLVLAPRAVKQSFAVQTYDVGVYWDSGGTREVTFISWGELTPGSTKQVNVFIQNKALVHGCFLNLQVGPYVPSTAKPWLKLTWNYDYSNITLNTIIQVRLTLTVERNIWGVSDFSFTITISGTEHIIGDVNEDGRVNIFDAVALRSAFESTPSSPNWNPDCDYAEPYGVIDIFDMVMLGANYGVVSPG